MSSRYSCSVHRSLRCLLNIHRYLRDIVFCTDDLEIRDQYANQRLWGIMIEDGGRVILDTDNLDKNCELYEAKYNLFNQKDESHRVEYFIIMKERIYSVKIQSVNKVLDLLRSRRASPAAKKFKKISSVKNDRTIFHCCSSKLYNSRNRKRKKVTSSGFSRALVANEMRKCVMRHDWLHVAELLPLLLNGRSETEPLIWRYLVTELFYSPHSTLAKLNHFLEMCVNTHSSEFLKKVLTLPSQTEDPDST